MVKGLISKYEIIRSLDYRSIAEIKVHKFLDLGWRTYILLVGGILLYLEFYDGNFVKLCTKIENCF